MKARILCYAVVLAWAGQAEAEAGGSPMGADADVRIVTQDTMGDLRSATVDTIAQSARRPLLPERMSFVERGLWGENGILRRWGIASELTPEVRKSELTLRRTMLTAHQIGGFLTLGLLAASTYYGQRVLDGHWEQSDAHSGLVKVTIAAYAATGLLAVLSPPPYIRRDETSTTTVHKTLAWLHLAGMILTPIIGKMVWKIQPGPTPQVVQNNGAARFHQVSAYLTTAVFGASMVVLTF